jgi:hypothetical protein
MIENKRINEIAGHELNFLGSSQQAYWRHCGTMTALLFGMAVRRMLPPLCCPSVPQNCDGGLANLSYSWSTIGNLNNRSDMLALAGGGLTEFFCYDSLNRVTNTGFGNATSCSNGTTHYTVGYDALGNITGKSDTSCATAGCYAYNGAPHPCRRAGRRSHPRTSGS